MEVVINNCDHEIQNGMDPCQMVSRELPSDKWKILTDAYTGGEAMRFHASTRGEVFHIPMFELNIADMESWSDTLSFFFVLGHIARAGEPSQSNVLKTHMCVASTTVDGEHKTYYGLAMQVAKL